MLDFFGYRVRVIDVGKLRGDLEIGFYISCC